MEETSKIPLFLRIRKVMTVSTALLAIAATAGAQGKIDGPWSGVLHAGPQTLNMTLTLLQKSDGTSAGTMDCLEQGIKGFPVQVVFLSTDSVNIAMTSLGASYTARLEQGVLKGKFSQNGMNFDLDLQHGAPVLKRPQTPQAPFPYKTQEVTFVNAAGHASLSGTLTYPKGYVRGGKRVPVVLMVTGSGPENRDEEVFGHKPFLVLADFFARNGIASLRYDDRGTGGSKGDVSQLTTAVNRDDAAAGVAYLRGLKDFNNVGVLGHSEGGSVAFMLAANGKTDFIVSMAGPGVRGDSVLYSQSHRICMLQGAPQDIADAQFAKFMRSENPWVKFFIKYDPSEDIKGVKCPVLALNGEKDAQVIADMNLTAIEKLLPQSDKNKVKSYPDLNHLFQHCQTGNPAEYAGIEETMSPEVMSDIAEWIKGL
jgi:fermentation-respiration switch protein FrsA (DUF1100 family)